MVECSTGGENVSDVLLSITGSRELMGDDDTVDLTVAGSLTSEADRYTLRYTDERFDGDGSETQIVVEDGAVIMTRSGDEATEMMFERDKPYSSFYNTPFGRLDMLIMPTMVATEMGEGSGKIELEYIMNIAGAQIVNKLHLSYKKDA